MTSNGMRLQLRIWRQNGPQSKGEFKPYTIDGISPDMSFLEMLDILNIQLVQKGEPRIEFEHDCREGICGSCALVINGSPHGPDGGTTTCQLHMRRFKSGDSITIEPWRAKAFPILRDLVTDRSAFDRIMATGGFISVATGNAPDANSIPVGKEIADEAMDSAACIGCGACVAACKNASAMLFVSAKVKHMNLLPQGQPERYRRAVAMVTQMDQEGFGACSNTGACEAACPKEIQLENIAFLNREIGKALLCQKERKVQEGGAG